jgi:hypothetical protein
MVVRTCILILTFFFFVLPVHAEDSLAGYVKKVKGEVSIIRQDKAFPARIGEKVYRSDTLKTGSNGSIGITFKDDTLISLGPSSEVIVNDFEFSPAEGKMSIITRMLKGTMVYLSGIIAKLSPNAVRVETPVGNIGLRGTRFAVKIEGNNQGPSN